jgi:hypothetical protein
LSELFHVSDRFDIARCEPRSIGDGPPLVWAVDADHLVNYLVPRDCPRVCFRARPESSEADRALLDGAFSVVGIEAAWEQRVLSSRLAVYTLPNPSFESADETAGYWTSRVAVEPKRCEALSDLPAEIELRHGRLVVVPSLWPLFDRVEASSLKFSMIRMRNAQAR